MAAARNPIVELHLGVGALLLGLFRVRGKNAV